MPDQGKLDALAKASYRVQRACATCLHFTSGGDHATGWGRCAKIPHVHAAHGPQATTGVRAEGVCPQHELEPAAARELERSGYARFLPLGAESLEAIARWVEAEVSRFARRRDVTPGEAETVTVLGGVLADGVRAGEPFHG